MNSHGREDRIRTCDPLVPNQVLYQAELLPVKYGAPERSRTHNLLIRSQTLYPIELRAHIKFNGAEDRNRTGTVVTYRRILSPVRLPVPPPRQINGAEDGIRTRDPNLGKVVFYH
jgi:hypothetical protein